MSTELTTTNGTTAVGFLTAEKIDLIKRTIANEATHDELELFLHQCRRTGLDPLARQIYFIKRGGKASIQTGIDGFRLIAERTGEYRGQTPVQWCGDDGVWKEVWLDKKPPAAARVGIYREGYAEPLYRVATWAEYAQSYGPMWKKMPALMLSKCAESLALRAAFPQELSGLYTTDEMHQADDHVEETAQTAPAQVQATPATPSRPWTAEAAKEMLVSVAHRIDAGEIEMTATKGLSREDRVKRTAIAMSNLTKADDDRRAIMGYVFGSTSHADLTDGECETLVRWVNAQPEQVEGQERPVWVPDADAVAESKRILEAASEAVEEAEIVPESEPA